MRILGNRQYDFMIQPNQTVPSRDYAGQSGPVVDAGDFNPAPPWIWNGFFSYDTGAFNTTFSVRHLSKGILNVERTGPEEKGYDPNLPNSISTNRVNAATYFGLAMSYRFGQSSGKNFELFGTIDNPLDKKPPVAPGGGGGAGSNYPTNPVYFDTFGMRWRAGARVAFQGGHERAGGASRFRPLTLPHWRAPGSTIAPLPFVGPCPLSLRSRPFPMCGSASSRRASSIIISARSVAVISTARDLPAST
ncbi:hypothetical protein U1769_15865 [Sphingomonas sp. ZT3P38]|uniref:hypothetical protein n=1 Tax=Parasphingomonas zepuensis TaxID=3096161 RepID=UPI002FCC7323